MRGGNSLGAIKLTTVFRQKARAEATSGLVVVAHDEIRVPPAAHLRTALDAIAAAVAHGDSEGARRVAEKAAAEQLPDIVVAGYEDLNNLASIAALRGDKAKALALFGQALSAGPPPDAHRAIASNMAHVQGRH